MDGIYVPDPMITAVCVPVSSASLLAICASESVQESGVECVLYVVTVVYGSVWSCVCIVRGCSTRPTQKWLGCIYLLYIEMYNSFREVFKKVYGGFREVVVT